jgi:hypothetical protein
MAAYYVLLIYHLCILSAKHCTSLIKSKSRKQPWNP